MVLSDRVVYPIDTSALHIPVLLDCVLSILSPDSSKIIVDGTFGGGGYSVGLLSMGSNVLAMDRDPDVLFTARCVESEYGSRFRFASDCFSNLESHIDCAVDGIVLDLGVSSMQLDEWARGFSFRVDGPLDMRMSKSGVSAADVVNGLDRGDLTRVIGILGDESRASLISAAIVERRRHSIFTSTLDLATLISDLFPSGIGSRIHPATRTFQALRIFVNGELDELSKALFAAERVLKPNGCLCIVSFHSLEDKMVKKFFKHTGESASVSRHFPVVESFPLTFSVPCKGVVRPDAHEVSINPRSRSAKLRYAIRTDAPASCEDLSIFGLPSLASLDSVGEVL